MEILVIILALCTGSLLSALVGIVGSRRKIGFGWAFLFSALLTPIVGLIITLLSDRLPYGEKKWGCLLPFVIFFILAIAIALVSFFLMSMAL